jgi:hypothetical protein
MVHIVPYAEDQGIDAVRACGRLATWCCWRLVCTHKSLIGAAMQTGPSCSSDLGHRHRIDDWSDIVGLLGRCFGPSVCLEHVIGHVFGVDGVVVVLPSVLEHCAVRRCVRSVLGIDDIAGFAVAC